MKKRLIKQIIKRFTHLPKGIDFFKYLLNSIALLISQKLRLLKLPHPNAIMLEITNCCQLRCITCAREYKYGRLMDVGHMDFEAAKKVIDDNHLYLDKIALTGLGEPLLYPKLTQLVEYIRERNKGVLLFLSTNAQLSDTVALISSIADTINTVQISIDGIGRTFEKIRKKGTFSTFTENCRELAVIAHRHSFAVKLNMVVFKDNFREMKDIIQFARDYGIYEVCFNSLNKVAIDETLVDYSFYRSKIFSDEIDAARILAKQLGVYLEYPNIGRKNTFATCPYPWGNFTITWDGYLVPCCAKPFWKEMHFGNVFRDGLMRCINHEKMIVFRRLSKENRTPAFCHECHHVN